MTAKETLQKNGCVRQLSEQYFNRHKGTEWNFMLKLIDGKEVIIGWAGWYPNTPESYFQGNGYLFKDIESFCKEWDKREPVFDTLKKLGHLPTTEVLSMERYRAILKQATEHPACPQCGQHII